MGSRLVELAHECHTRGQQVARLSSSSIFQRAGEAYDSWHRSLPGFTHPHTIIAQPFDTAEELRRLKNTAKEERTRLRREMIAIQEEMDWLLYAAYGLLLPSHEAVGMEVMSAIHPWELDLGQRPFELWGAHTKPPGDWDEQRKRIWLARLTVIQTNEHVSRIENQVYKRRWVYPDFELEFDKSYKWWLREKAEFFLERTARGGPVSLADWAEGLWKDARIRAAAGIHCDGPITNAKMFEPILRQAVEEETVPDDEVYFKARHEQLRGSLKVPRERFRSLTSKPGYYIWASNVR